jgi:hypothetical protein
MKQTWFCHTKGCPKKAVYKYYCELHKEQGMCNADGCNEYQRRGLYCDIHGQRHKRNGHTNITMNEKGAGSINTAGYRLLTINGKRVYEHVYVAEKALGKSLPPNAVVHHMNEDPADNHTPFNLILCPDQAYHMLLHKRMRDMKYNG